MSLPAKQMLGEVQMLDTKLKANEQCTEKIVQQFTLLETRLKAMQQYRDHMDEMNVQAGQRPKAELVKRSQTAIFENRKIRELHLENQDLKCALNEHQDALEIIMNKYRAQMAAFMELSKERKEQAPQDDKQLQMYIEKMCELVEVANESVERDEKYSLENEKELARLRYENKHLKKCLGFGKEFGSLT